jgi:hypothetical protein
LVCTGKSNKSDKSKCKNCDRKKQQITKSITTAQTETTMALATSSGNNHALGLLRRPSMGA